MGLRKDNQYLRVENIRIGKNLMQFFIRIYDGDRLVQDITKNIPFDLEGKNPFIQAYNWLQNNGFSGWTSDEAVEVPVVASIVEPEPILEVKSKKKKGAR